MPAFRSLGDLSTTFLLSRQTHQLKTQIQKHSTELTTGRTSDLSKTVKGDFRSIASIEHGLSLAKNDRLSINEAQGFATAAQAALGVVQDRSEYVSGVLLTVPDSPNLPTINRTGREVRQAFEAFLGAMNQRSADRAIFAGDATDGMALASVDTMMADIEATITGLSTAADVEAAVDLWFDTPGTGFDALGYVGSDTALSKFNLGGGESTAMSITASDPALRKVMKGFAMGVLAGSSAFAGTVEEKVALAQNSALRVIDGTSAVVDIRAKIGASEAAIETAKVRNSTEMTSLELARSELVGADPYEAATKLETAKTQLETLFALTARISRMSLVDYLR